MYGSKYLRSLNANDVAKLLAKADERVKETVTPKRGELGLLKTSF